jgi:3,8-divinyl chlorophyllide a/chlorophyllide a reductase subunit Z
VQLQPMLVQISAAKTLRDRAEHDARAAGELRVTAGRVRKTLGQVERVESKEPA